ncbi:hypothetical protein GCM10010336_28310 [Streptomyces goshikiensis]|nr:hypothetical protein GCM10010336_28310 [Streptomyces goshikiensis]
MDVPFRAGDAAAAREAGAQAVSEPGTAIPRSSRRSYHPSQEGSPRKAVEYLAAARAARAAAGAVGRAVMS